MVPKALSTTSFRGLSSFLLLAVNGSPGPNNSGPIIRTTAFHASRNGSCPFICFFVLSSCFSAQITDRRQELDLPDVLGREDRGHGGSGETAHLRGLSLVQVDPAPNKAQSVAADPASLPDALVH